MLVLSSPRYIDIGRQRGVYSSQLLHGVLEKAKIMPPLDKKREVHDAKNLAYSSILRRQ